MAARPPERVPLKEIMKSVTAAVTVQNNKFSGESLLLEKGCGLSAFQLKMVEKLTKGSDSISVEIIGGNECMIRQYISLCDTYQCKANMPKEERLNSSQWLIDIKF